MFTGIIETLGTIENITDEGTNKHFVLSSSFTNELKVDQSLSHNGVCLTVVKIEGNQYTVTAIKETLDRTSMKHWKVGDLVNLERCMPANGRFDGHVVQGHVDTTAICKSIVDENGSWKYGFEYATEDLTVEKGSITVNGTSLTVVDSLPYKFSVAIIPYTYDHTVFKNLKVGDKVNIEFDIIGKYVARLLGK
ncbi:MAG: riboflavin synthase [bacterium]|nr:riboflavin synthase [bacterium]